jgi:hypothetical protein
LKDLNDFLHTFKILMNQEKIFILMMEEPELLQQEQ